MFRANVVGVSTNLASVSFFIDEVSAVAITSAGAPCWIWVTNAPDPAKLYVTDSPGSEVFNAVWTSLNDSVSDAAANTFSEPESFRVVDGEPAPLDVAAAVVVVDVLLLEPHPATATDNASDRTTAHITLDRPDIEPLPRVAPRRLAPRQLVTIVVVATLIGIRHCRFETERRTNPWGAAFEYVSGVARGRRGHGRRGHLRRWP